jgi:hypothetical protein
MPLAMSGREKTSITLPSNRIYKHVHGRVGEQKIQQREFKKIKQLTSNSPVFLQVNTNSVPLAQHDGSASYSPGAFCPQEQ